MKARLHWLRSSLPPTRRQAIDYTGDESLATPKATRIIFRRGRGRPTADNTREFSLPRPGVASPALVTFLASDDLPGFPVVQVVAGVTRRAYVRWSQSLVDLVSLSDQVLFSTRIDDATNSVALCVSVDDSLSCDGDDQDATVRRGVSVVTNTTIAANTTTDALAALATAARREIADAILSVGGVADRRALARRFGVTVQEVQRVIRALERDGRTVSVVVADTAPGLAPDAVARHLATAASIAAEAAAYNSPEAVAAREADQRALQAYRARQWAEALTGLTQLGNCVARALKKGWNPDETGPLPAIVRMMGYAACGGPITFRTTLVRAPDKTVRPHMLIGGRILAHVLVGGKPHRKTVHGFGRAAVRCLPGKDPRSAASFAPERIELYALGGEVAFQWGNAIEALVHEGEPAAMFPHTRGIAMLRAEHLEALGPKGSPWAYTCGKDEDENVRVTELVSQLVRAGVNG